MTSHRMQHVLPGAAVLLLAVVVTYLSFTQQPAEAFLFPRVISVAFIVLAVWNFIRAVSGMAKVGRGISLLELSNILPGLVVMVVYAFFAAKALGFYVASTIAFFIIYSLYDPAYFFSAKDWFKRIMITAVFMAVIYGLFALVLQVQTPRGLFI